MPKRKDIHRILIIGSGPSVIGQAAEFDYSTVQACKALRTLGYRLALVSSNPAAIATEPATADAVYIEPLNVKVLDEIIAAERPDALLPNMGGQMGLNLTWELHRAGILDRCGVQVIGVSVEAIGTGEDRRAFKQAMDRLGIETPRGRTANSVEDAEQAAEELGFPVVIRPAFTTGGTGGGLVYNMEELQTLAARGLAASLAGQVRIEQSLIGWEELALEIVRDSDNQMITVGSIENVDAMGIHTGDSCCVSPMLTIDADLQLRLQRHAYAVMADMAVVGCAGIKFAHDPQTGQVAVIEMNPRATRSSALASKATGFPVARVAALLAGGLTLDEIPYRPDKTLETYTAATDRVAVKLARWDFGKFEGIRDELGTQMRAVGESMGIGKTYKEALQKAVRSLEIDRHGFGFANDFHQWPPKQLLSALSSPASERHFQIYEALRKGVDSRKLAEITHIKPWFIEQMQELVTLEAEILAYKGRQLPDALLQRAKKEGFADLYLADLLGASQSQIRQQRVAAGAVPAFGSVPGSGVKGASCFYSTYHAPDRVDVGNAKKIMVLGSGPNRIGQGIGFDNCCVQSAAAIREAGFKALMVNCNPASVSTDADAADRLYFEPLTAENVLGICEKEQPDGVVVQFGGQTPLGIAKELAAAGVPILGTGPDTIDLTEDRDRFRQILRELGIPQPESAAVHTLEEARQVAERIGYPLMVRLPNASSGRTAEVVQDEQMLQQALTSAVEISPRRPLIMDRFLDNAIEAEADAVADGTDAFVPVVIEHIELAGIHSGDSACVIPPISIAPKQLETIYTYSRKIAAALNVVGLLNIQFAIFENTVYVLQANPYASRTVPVVSKVCGLSMPQLATRILLGQKVSDLDLKPRLIPHYAVKESVFPFNMFPEVDPLLGPEMLSTGEVLGLSHSYGRAFFKAQEATQATLPLQGVVLFTIADRDKTAALEPVRLFRDLGFRIVATRGTHEFLREHGIDTEPVHKLGFGRPDLVDAIKTGEVQLMVNTPSGRQSTWDSSEVRKAAIKYQIPYVTTTAAAIAAAKGIAARRQGAPAVRSLQQYLARVAELSIGSG